MNVDATKPWLHSYPAQVPPSVEPIPSTNAYELLADAARRHPTRPAIAWFGRHISYRDLRRECERFAMVLAGLGVGRGDRVALIMPNCPQYVIAYYATLRLGAVVAGNNPLYTERELTHQLADAEPSVAIVLDVVYPNAAGALATVGVPNVVVTGIRDYMPAPLKQLAPLQLRRQARREGRPWPPIPPGAPVLGWSRLMMRAAGNVPPVAEVDGATEPAAFVYTGGTTGVAKAAVLSHRNIVANAMQGAAWFIDTEDGREAILCVLPFFHCYGMTVGMNVGIVKAAKLILVPRFDLDLVLKVIRKERPSMFPGVPKLYLTISQAGARASDLSSIRYCLSGAGALPAPVAQRFEELTGGTLVEGYGLTEASPIAVANPLDGSGRTGTIGVPIPDTDCRVVDLADADRVVGPGEQGELWVRGPQVMLGYWNRPDETDGVLHEGWLRTGDVVVMDEDGFFRIVDRIKDMIKVSGFNVYPSEVEEVLHRHPKILKACVAGVPDPHGGELVKAYVVLRPGQQATVDEIVAWCRDPRTGLSGYRIPARIEFRDALPETVIGKVLRRVLVEEEMQRVAAHAAR